MELPNRSNRSAGRGVLLGALVALAVSGAAVGDTAQDPHAHHHPAAAATDTWERTTVGYTVPEVTLVRADGAEVDFPKAIDDGKPVILDFIFTTCTAVCPILSQTFAQVQSRLGDEGSKVRMVSISIDPEQDTPARLTEYAKKFHAGPQWSFYTGTVKASVALQKAFDVYRTDKMNHVAVTFLRAAPGKPWVRLEGFVPPDELVKETRQFLAAN